MESLGPSFLFEFVSRTNNKNDLLRMNRRGALRSARELSLVYSKLHRIHLIAENVQTFKCLLLGLTAVNMGEASDLRSVAPDDLAHMYMLLALTFRRFRYSVFQFLAKYVEEVLYRLF